MKTMSFGQLAFGLVGLVAIMLAVIGAPSGRPAPRTVAATAPPPPPPSVSAAGFTLTSISDELPPDDGQYPGPHADVVNANCTACHSASMALTQPSLSGDQWKAIVTKMRKTYHAPVAEGDVAAIVGYLTSMPGQQTTGRTSGEADLSRVNPSDGSGGTG